MLSHYTRLLKSVYHQQSSKNFLVSFAIRRMHILIAKVCDAMCGFGKTSACIAMMNQKDKERYIFITPYLSEVDRVKSLCKNRKFYSPEKSYEHNFSKLKAFHELLRQGRDIASTHALFSYYTEETKQLILQGGYTLVLDEVMNIFQPAEISNGDINILIKSRTIKACEQEFVWNDDDYTDGAFLDTKFKAKSNNLLKYRNEMYFWSIPPDIFISFKGIYILTYMFEYQIQRYFFDVYHIKYELIGVKKERSVYKFCPMSEMDRRLDLRSKIHILEHDKLNEIGNANGSLSFTWYNRAHAESGRPKLEQLRCNLYNVFHNVYKTDANSKMWSTFKAFKNVLKGKGYANGFIVYNKRATNEFSNKRHLAYCLNVYMQTWAKNYLIEKGAKNISENMYAISTLIQWIFRSAIRNGEEVWLYLPSKRMRDLFKEWLNNLAEGKDLTQIILTEKKVWKDYYNENALKFSGKINKSKKIGDK